jgi:hypothetical protein
MGMIGRFSASVSALLIAGEATGRMRTVTENSVRITAIVLAAVGLVSCTESNLRGPTTTDEQTEAKATGPDSPVSASDIADNPLIETDRLMLADAARACQSSGADGYAAFFDAFIRSEEVRRKYSAPKISVARPAASGDGSVTKSTPVSEYHDFPITMEDHYRRPARPSGPDEYIEVVMNQSSSNRISVEWTRVRYTGTSDGGDDLGTPVMPDGRPYDPERQADGQLLFAPTADCWELVADIRFKPR